MALPLLLLSAFGSGYFLREALDPAPPSSPLGEAYEPPFNGGQCQGVSYYVDAQFRFPDGNLGGGRFRDIRIGAIEGVQKINGNWYVVAGDGIGTSYGNYDQFDPDPLLEIVAISRVDGNPDNCGNLPNPSPTPPTSSSGLASSPSPSSSGFQTVSEGLTPLATSGISAALAAALGALKAAGDLAAAAGAIADALAALKEFLDTLEENEDKDKKKENRRLLQYNFGSVSGDGYLELFPANSPTDRELLFLDIQVKTFPIGRGKIFGENSPNRYVFEPFGNIRLVTPTFGILSTHLVEHVRTSIEGSDKATGFFYHFGLDKRVTANITGFYSELIPEPGE